jgi:hypothetical protein
VFGHQFGVEWRQFAMPIDDLWSAHVIGRVHMTPWFEEARPDAPRSGASSNDVMVAMG